MREIDSVYYHNLWENFLYIFALSTHILDVAIISEAVGGSLLHFFSGRLATRVSMR